MIKHKGSTPLIIGNGLQYDIIEWGSPPYPLIVGEQLVQFSINQHSPTEASINNHYEGKDNN